MLAYCHLYIGTDTGPTHLAAALAKRLLLFRLEDGSPDLLSAVTVPTASLRGATCVVLEKAWEHPELIYLKAMDLLVSSNAT
jgi:hypothetical protein